MRRRSSRLAAGMGPALLLAGAATASAQLPEYVDIQLQARTNLLVNDEGFNLPPGSSFNSITPSINDEGWVAFPVQVVTAPGSASGVGIWHGRNAVGGIAHRHDPAPGGDVFISTSVGINALGEVAYAVHEGGSNYRMWLYDPAVGAVGQVGLLPLTPTSFSSIALSDAGVIGYQASLGAGRAFASTLAFAQPADSLAHVYENTIDPGSPFNYLYSPDMNNQRVIAGKLNVGAGSDYSRQEIHLFPAAGGSQVIAVNTASDPASLFGGFDNGLSVNDHGAVAVVARLASGNVRAVYRLDGDAAVEIARVGDGPILEIDFFRPAINNAGLVAFRARDSQGQAVYVGDGDGLVRVIGNGDPILTDLGEGQLGQHDSSPVFGGAPGINGNGDVVVAAGLHPAGNNQVEWGSGIIVAWTAAEPDVIFADGFESE